MMHEPVWNGGDSYFMVRTDRVTDQHVFIECDYKDRHGDKAFPYAFYTNGDEIKTQKVYQERWGKAYRLYLGDLERVYFYFTVAWDGYDEESEGEITHSRPSFKDMVESIEYYLDKYKDRDAHLECCSMETSAKTHIVNLIDHVFLPRV